MNNPAANMIYAALAALYLGYSAIFNFQFITSKMEPVPASIWEIARGQSAAQFETTYRHSALYRDWASDMFAGVRYRIFGEGRRGVIVGDDGWLFSSEEFEGLPGQGNAVDDAVNFVGDVRTKLASRGVQLVVALLPAKADIYGEHLDGHRMPAEPAGRYETVRSLMIEADIAVPDLRKLLLAEKQVQQVFLKTDTHWTPEGAIAVASAISEALGRRGTAPKPTEPILVAGDLDRFIGNAEEPREAVRQYELDSLPTEAVDLFAAAEVPVVLVGTSYSANPNWGFEQALKAALQEDVLNMAEPGLGPFTPMRKYLESESFRQSPPKIVIWEIPVRLVRTFDEPEKDTANLHSASR